MHGRAVLLALCWVTPLVLGALDKTKVSALWGTDEQPDGLSHALKSTPSCAASGRPPRMPRHALKFCHIFPDKSCCIPAQDAEIEEHYFTLLDAGDICAKESSMAKDALKMIFCAACSPKQPDYIDEDGSFKICSNLAEKVAPEQFDDCGMVRVAERGNLCGGDDVVVPSDQWPNTKPKGSTDAKHASLESDWNLFDSAAGDPGDLSGADGNGAYLGGPNGPATTCCDFADKAACPVGTGGQGPSKDRRDGRPEHSAYSCKGFWKFINDPAGAYPPFLDGGTTQYIQIHDCQESPTRTCNTECYTGAAAPNAAVSAAMLAAGIAAVLMTAHA